MNITAIIQARIGSTRLKGKVLLKVMGKTILEYVIERVKAAKLVSNVLIATTNNKEDDIINELANTFGVNIYRGSQDDVLDRFYKAATDVKAGHIVRITADCPLIDPAVIDDVVGYYIRTNADYCSNTITETFPDGEDVEVFSFKALSSAWNHAGLLSEREHVTPYIKKHPELFKIESFKSKTDFSKERWTLDEKKDFLLIKSILEVLYPENPKFSMHDVLQFLDKNPHLRQINKDICRNAGYKKSLKEDRLMEAD